MTRETSTLRLTGSILALALAASLGNLACRQEAYSTTTEDTVLGTPPGGRVDLSGHVERIYGEAFLFDPAEGVINADEVLVVPPTPALMPEPGADVRVRGTVREMLVADAETKIGKNAIAAYVADVDVEKVVVAEAVSVSALAAE